MQLRPYQQLAVNAIYDYLRKHDGNPCAVLPTGAGKTPVLATICRDAVCQWGGRVLVLSHVKELLQQAVDKLAAIAPEVRPGVYSAGLGRRDTKHDVIVAGIQSVHKKADKLGPFDLIVVDECHLMPPDGDGMYQSFLADMRIINPHARLIGLTATPYRLRTGHICDEGSLLNDICYEVGVAELVRDGYLCRLVSKRGETKADLSSVHVRGGEFIESEMQAAMDTDALVQAAVQEILAYTQSRNAVLIFSAGIQHGQHITEELRWYGVSAEFVCGTTPQAERDAIIARFQSGETKYLVNPNVLTTGFDAPHVDCVVLLRATMSPGLYYQIVGRGFRLHPSKSDCLVLDYGDNILRHGPVDEIKAQPKKKSGTSEITVGAVKECPKCQSVIKAGYGICPDCGYFFPSTEKPAHAAQATDAAILSEDQEIERETRQVKEVVYAVHTKKGADETAPKTLRVEYYCGVYERYSEWVCIEHTGYARSKAAKWWSERSPDPFPTSAQHAVDIANAGGLAATLSITLETKPGEKWPSIVGYELGDKPAPLPEEDRMRIAAGAFDDDDLPF